MVPVIFRLVMLLEYPLFYAIYLSSIIPEQVTVAPGLTNEMTSALSAAGIPGYWALIIVRTLMMGIISVIACRRIPTQIWSVNPRDLLRLEGWKNWMLGKYEGREGRL
jgi:hypothetical protein